MCMGGIEPPIYPNDGALYPFELHARCVRQGSNLRLPVSVALPSELLTRDSSKFFGGENCGIVRVSRHPMQKPFHVGQGCRVPPATTARADESYREPLLALKVMRAIAASQLCVIRSNHCEDMSTIDRHERSSSGGGQNSNVQSCKALPHFRGKNGISG